MVAAAALALEALAVGQQGHQDLLEERGKETLAAYQRQEMEAAVEATPTQLDKLTTAVPEESTVVVAVGAELRPRLTLAVRAQEGPEE
jgi:hypothetical protein